MGRRRARGRTVRWAPAVALLLAVGVAGCGEGPGAATPGERGRAAEGQGDGPAGDGPAGDAPAGDGPSREGGGGEGPGEGVERPTEFGPEGVDLPLSFDDVRLMADPSASLSVSVHGPHAFSAGSEFMSAYDLDGGLEKAAVQPEGRPVREYEPSQLHAGLAPAVAEVGGRTLAVAPFVVHRDGSGTSASQVALELRTLDAETLEPGWSAVLDVPAGAMSARIAAVRGETAVVQIGTGQYVEDVRAVMAVDLTTREVLWTQEDETVLAVSSSHVLTYDGNFTIGGDLNEGELRSRGAEDGSEAWNRPAESGEDFYPAGPDRFAGVISPEAPTADGNQDVTLLDAATGRPAGTVRGGLDANPVCRDDGEDGVCVWGGDDGQAEKVVAFDGATGKELWHLPAEGRIAPEVTAVRGGAVYGQTSSGSVVLDMASGRDLGTSTAPSPEVVGTHFGLAVDENEGSFEDAVLRAHPVTG